MNDSEKSDPDEQDYERTEPLLGRYLKGHPDTARRLFSRLEEPLRQAARRHPLFDSLEDFLSVDDLVGELWVAMLKSGALERFEDRGRGSLRAFTRGCLDRVMLGLFNRQRRIKRGGDAVVVPLDPATSDGPGVPPPRSPAEGPSTVVWVQDWIESCRRALPEAEATVWRLRIESQLGFGEIARQIGRSRSAARGLFFRASERLLEKGLLDELPPGG